MTYRLIHSFSHRSLSYRFPAFRTNNIRSEGSGREAGDFPVTRSIIPSIT